MLAGALALACGAAGGEPGRDAENARSLRIVAFGDSTTAPRDRVPVYAELLQKELRARGVDARAINAGAPGATTETARARFPKDVLAHDPDLVVIQFGINDAMVDVWKDPPATGPRVEAKWYEQNLRYFVSKLRSGHARVILMTPNPLRWTPALKKRYGRAPYRVDDPDGLNVLLSKYAQIVRRVAEAEKVPLVDIYGAFEKHGKGQGQSVDDMLLDGMHPNAAGHRLVAALLLRHLLPLVTAKAPAPTQPDEARPPKAAAMKRGSGQLMLNVLCTEVTHAADQPCTLGAALVPLSDGSVMHIYASGPSAKDLVPGSLRLVCRVTADGGKTWSPARPIHEQSERQLACPSALRTRDGVLHAFFLRVKDMPVSARDIGAVSSGELCAVRSSDDGKTWGPPVVLSKGRVCSTNGAVQTRKGDVVVPFSRLSEPAGCVAHTAVSSDGGVSWRVSEAVDIGGRGRDGSALDPCVVEKKNGLLWMLAQTSRGAFWEAHSQDGGRTWAGPRQTPIAASSAPGHVTRLLSGRLALVWNPRGEGRRELHLALSDDDGETWGEPVVLAQGKHVACPFVFNPAPGDLWVGFHDFRAGPDAPRVAHVRLAERSLLAALSQEGTPARTREGTGTEAEATVAAPKVIRPPIARGSVESGSALVVLPGGAWEVFLARTMEGAARLCRRRSDDAGLSWSKIETLRELPGGGWSAGTAILDNAGEVHLFLLRARGEGQTPGVDRYQDIWHVRSTLGRTQWGEPRRIFEGWVDSLRNAVQLPAGRLVLPFAHWVAWEAGAPRKGASAVTTLCSDDGGDTWTVSQARLMVPTPDGVVSDHAGASDPTIVSFRGGRLWMLMRTQTGRLYESFSRDGARWTPPQASRFRSPDSPAFALRLPDERVVLFWNDCADPLAGKGRRGRGGQDVLHAAVYDPDDMAWLHHREVYRDPERNERPPAPGRCPAADPRAVVARDGTIVLATGPTKDGRSLLVIDPRWLRATKHRDEFAGGLSGWSVFRPPGPGEQAPGGRVQGARLVDDPTRASGSALRLRTLKGAPGDGAVWNFPRGRRGRLTLRAMLLSGFGGIVLSLADRFHGPTDAAAEERALFRVAIGPKGKLRHAQRLRLAQWFTLELLWDVGSRSCRVLVDGKVVDKLPLDDPATEGPCYLRLRSTAPEADLAGMMVESVRAQVSNVLPRAARRSPLVREPSAPVLLRTAPQNQANLVGLPNRELKCFYVGTGRRSIRSITSSDGGSTWEDERIEFWLPGPGANSCAVLRTDDAELHAFFLVWRGTRGPLAVARFLDAWHCKTKRRGAVWGECRPVFRGFVDSLNASVQLRSGRILLPHHVRIPLRQMGPPSGCCEALVSYSRDGGRTWAQSPTRLTAPCTADYNGANLGATDPAVLELSDRPRMGAVWMLMRTQTGFLYESFSENGVDWTPARPSRFRAPDTPAMPLRLPDGRIVVFWNNCETPPKVDGRGVYGGRDALHAAVSSDGGKTWRGYREVYLDPLRDVTPLRGGDRGTAYPHAVLRPDGKIVLVTGQGEGRRAILLISPAWLLETRREHDFRTDGVEDWSLFKSVGEARLWRRKRVEGAKLIQHPTQLGVTVLHLGRPDEEPGDGAVWSFPFGAKGEVSLKMMLRAGFGGASVALADRYVEPTDERAEKQALFHLAVDATGQMMGGPRVGTERWVTLTLRWDVARKTCGVLVDGEPAMTLPMQGDEARGACYLRLRSSAAAVDPVGWLVESVKASVVDASGPAPERRRAP